MSEYWTKRGCQNSQGLIVTKYINIPAMSKIKTMHLLLTIATIVFCSCVSVKGQDSTAQPISRHILMVNKTHETLKEINIGDPIRLKLTNSTKVKGHVISIDSTFFTVDNIVVYIEQIKKISTKKV